MIEAIPVEVRLFGNETDVGHQVTWWLQDRSTRSIHVTAPREPDQPFILRREVDR